MQHSIVICIDQNALFRLNLVGKPDYSTGERATANISRDTIQEVIFAAKYGECSKNLLYVQFGQRMCIFMII